MRQAYVHEATLVMDPQADERAPGAAVTVALCGHWDHDPPCPMAPHFTSADLTADELHVRVLFAAGPEDEPEVRRRIDLALRGEWELPHELTTSWQLTRSWPGEVSPSERDHAGRLVHGG